MKDTRGPEGLVPSALVFGEFFQIRTPSETQQSHPKVQERAEIATLARGEMAENMVSLHLKCAFRRAVPPDSNRAYEPGEKVLVSREKVVSNRIGEWIGPFAPSLWKTLIRIRNLSSYASLSEAQQHLLSPNLAQALLNDIATCRKNLKPPFEDRNLSIKAFNPNNERDLEPETNEAKMT